MNSLVFPVNTLVEASVLGGLEEVSSPSDPESALSPNAEGSAPSDGIQQVAWTGSNVIGVDTLTQSSGVAAQSEYRITRDDAPSVYLVIPCLLGFAILSLYLGYRSLPQYWLEENSLAVRERRGR